MVGVKFYSTTSRCCGKVIAELDITKQEDFVLEKVSVMVEVETVSVAIAAAAVVAGVIYSSFQLREQTRSRKTDLVMRLYDRFSSNEFQNVWHTFRTSDYKKYHDIFETPKELFMAINEVCLFFEGVGILLKRKLANIEMVEDLFGETVVRAWESAKMPVTRARHQLNDPESYYYFEYLYNEMKKREQKGAKNG